MTNIEIIDNFLDEEYFLPIKTIMMNGDFPWYYTNFVVYNDENEILDLDTYQFIHMFYNGNNGNHSPYYNMMNPILDKLNVKAVIRIKSNLNTRKDNISIRKFHTDIHPDAYPTAKIAIYYINTNDGYTLFRDGTKVESVENRMVIFNNNIFHTGTDCTNKSNRIVINFNYLEHD